LFIIVDKHDNVIHFLKTQNVEKSIYVQLINYNNINHTFKLSFAKYFLRFSKICFFVSSKISFTIISWYIPLSSQNFISFSAFFTLLYIASGLSVALKINLFSNSYKLGGFKNKNIQSNPVEFTFYAPTTSISNMQIFPSSLIFWTSPLCVP